MRGKIIIAVLLLGLVILQGCINESSSNVSGEGKKVVMFKSPYCGCCSGYAEYLEKNGFEVEVKVVENIDSIKEKYGIPYKLRSCHTSIIDGYVVEGHIPIEAVNKLLNEKPEIRGIALPGMPAGSPGMGGVKTTEFEIIGMKEDGQFLFTKI